MVLRRNYEILGLPRAAHMRIGSGSLTQIHNPEINFVMQPVPLDSAALRAIKALDVPALVSSETGDKLSGGNQRKNVICRTDNANSAQLAAKLDEALAAGLKDKQKRLALVTALVATVETFASVYRGRKDEISGQNFSGQIGCELMAIGAARGILHRDNYSEQRGFLTIKGGGTLIASNAVRKMNIAGADPDKEDVGRGWETNSYGDPRAAPINTVWKLPPLQLTIWKGDADPHHNQLIHAEPAVTTDDEARLVMIMEPMEMRLRAQQRADKFRDKVARPDENPVGRKTKPAGSPKP
jgi:hypothetical protein